MPKSFEMRPECSNGRKIDGTKANQIDNTDGEKKGIRESRQNKTEMEVACKVQHRR